jgi:hypothetical protein
MTHVQLTQVHRDKAIVIEQDAPRSRRAETSLAIQVLQSRLQVLHVWMSDPKAEKRKVTMPR